MMTFYLFVKTWYRRSWIQWTVNKHEEEVKAVDYSKVFGQNGKLESQNPLSPKN